MKLLIILLVFPSLSWADCLKPNARVAGAFALIENKGNLEIYLKKNLVAKSAKNQNCETMYMTAIRLKNEKARKLLESISYDECPNFVYKKPGDFEGAFFGPKLEDVTP